MNRTEFVIATAIILLVAFLVGWFTCWLVQRFSRVSTADVAEMDQMAKSLHDTEVAFDRAATQTKEHVAELNSLLSQSQAELRAAMEGLQSSRQEADELRSYIERENQG